MTLEGLSSNDVFNKLETYYTDNIKTLEAGCNKTGIIQQQAQLAIQLYTAADAKKLTLQEYKDKKQTMADDLARIAEIKNMAQQAAALFTDGLKKMDRPPLDATTLETIKFLNPPLHEQVAKEYATCQEQLLKIREWNRSIVIIAEQLSKEFSPVETIVGKAVKIIDKKIDELDPESAKQRADSVEASSDLSAGKTNDLVVASLHVDGSNISGADGVSKPTGADDSPKPKEPITSAPQPAQNSLLSTVAAFSDAIGLTGKGGFFFGFGGGKTAPTTDPLAAIDPSDLEALGDGAAWLEDEEVPGEPDKKAGDDKGQGDKHPALSTATTGANGSGDGQTLTTPLSNTTGSTQGTGGDENKQ